LSSRLKGLSFCFIISFVLSSDKKVLRLRKRPKETSSKAKTLRVLFGNLLKKELKILAITNGYNYYIGTIDEFNYLTTQNTNLRHVRRGGHQVIKHWLLRIVLINSYLLVYYNKVPKLREVLFRS
jgi:hypothetical protein